ncbi:MAG: hypothetical protein JNK37_07180 [Verrucomicrobiales bacterium]|nr:hypothetical protein [Verrucomicrobiales bacterium]
MSTAPEELTPPDDDGGYYRGRYYEAEDLRSIQQTEVVRRLVEMNRADLIAQGEDPDALLAMMDGKLETFLQSCAAYEAAEDSLLEYTVRLAESRRELILCLCRDYLYQRDHILVQLAGLPPERRAAWLDQYEELKETAREVFHELPLADCEALRRQGWRDSDWE